MHTYLAFRYLALIHPSTEGGLDTSHWWTMHALWFTPYWTASIILLPRRPSPYAWLVQRHGANPLRMQAVARKGPACSVLQFQVPPGCMDCCCQCILCHQPDFTGQHSQLEELIKSHGHLCDFYPKYHCELNFIEQYWGAAKAQYCVVPRAKTVREMENTVKECLDSVSLPQI